MKTNDNCNFILFYNVIRTDIVQGRHVLHIQKCFCFPQTSASTNLMNPDVNIHHSKLPFRRLSLDTGQACKYIKSKHVSRIICQTSGIGIIMVEAALPGPTSRGGVCSAVLMHSVSSQAIAFIAVNRIEFCRIVVGNDLLRQRRTLRYEDHQLSGRCLRTLDHGLLASRRTGSSDRSLLDPSHPALT